MSSRFYWAPTGRSFGSTRANSERTETNTVLISLNFEEKTFFWNLRTHESPRRFALDFRFGETQSVGKANLRGGAAGSSDSDPRGGIMRGGVMKPGRATGPRGLDSNIDPVCGRELRERDPQRAAVLEGEMVFFCSRECQTRFESDSEGYANRLKAGLLVSW